MICNLVTENHHSIKRKSLSKTSLVEHEKKKIEKSPKHNFMTYQYANTLYCLFLIVWVIS